ncbi:MAG: TetR/AcrR family transcriptional regulator [Burkholderiaceae bacterium]
MQETDSDPGAPADIHADADPPVANRPADRRSARLQAMHEARRAHVLAGAREAFMALGLEGTSMREIAQRAGYTPGAIYSYFPGKEDIYAALLGESLERLNAKVDTALATAHAPADRLRAGARAFFGFYRDNPRDLDLGFYLFQGMKPRGLTPALDDALNVRLRDALQPVRSALRAMGMPAGAALAETTGLFAHVAGLLLLSHTGRIRMFGQDPQVLFDAYLEGLAGRAGSTAGAAR